MNLYYFPGHLEHLTTTPIPLYSESLAAQMTKRQRLSLEVVTEEVIKKIGDHSCRFPQRLSTPEDIKLMEDRMKELNSELGIN